MKLSICALAALLATPSPTYADHRNHRATRRLQSNSPMSFDMIDTSTANNAAAVKPNYQTSSSSSKSSKGAPKTDLIPGSYTVCKERTVFAVNERFFTDRRPATNRILDISIEEEGYKFTAIVSIPGRLCPQIGLFGDDCPNDPEPGFTTFKYYFVGAQSFDLDEKNNLVLFSNYATYQTAEDTEAPLEDRGDSETNIFQIKVKGNKLYTTDAYYQGFGMSTFAQSSALVWALDGDCN